MDPNDSIDWNSYHPAARDLLNDPFFWSNDNCYAPHGNDTGHDLFSHFKEWNPKNPDKPAHVMARELLNSWEMGQIDLWAVDEAVVLQLYENESIALSVTNEAMIAVAFAAIKLRGCCDAATKNFAFKAIQRERLISATHRTDFAQEQNDALDLMAITLLKIPEQAA